MVDVRLVHHGGRSSRGLWRGLPTEAGDTPHDGVDVILAVVVPAQNSEETESLDVVGHRVDPIEEFVADLGDVGVERACDLDPRVREFVA